MMTGIDIQFVRDRYQKMTDEELIHVVNSEINNLTQEAQNIVNEEVKQRDLDTNSSNFLENGQSNSKTIATNGNGKSFEFALLFTLLFGPLGLLYVSITNGIILTILSLALILILGTFGYLGLIIVWIISIILAITATAKTNNKTIQTTKISNSDDRDNLLNQLSQLHLLKEKGVITDDIYEQERLRILAKFEKGA
jgi:hypothetical protein